MIGFVIFVSICHRRREKGKAKGYVSMKNAATTENASEMNSAQAMQSSCMWFPLIHTQDVDIYCMYCNMPVTIENKNNGFAKSRNSYDDIMVVGKILAAILTGVNYFCHVAI